MACSKMDSTTLLILYHDCLKKWFKIVITGNAYFTVCELLGNQSL